MFKEKLIASVREKISIWPEGAGAQTPDEFARELERVIQSAVEHATSNLQPADRETAVNTVKESIASNRKAFGRQNLTNEYRKVFDRFHVLCDVRKIEARADLCERFRYLFFRIATAFAIAGVVLLTGYLAHRWCIPLPLLRLPQ